MHVTDGQSNCLQGIKKPSGSVARIYLGAAIRHYLFKADRQPNEKASFEQLEIVRELTRRLRRDAGFSPWVPVGFAAAIAAALVIFLISHAGHTYFYQYPTNYLRVVQNIDLENGVYVVQRVSTVMGKEVVGPETEMHFRGHIPRFEAGHTLRWIRFDDFGSYQSVAADDRGYDLLREDKPTFVNGQWHRLPTLAPNCVRDWAHDHVVCDGGKANFN